MNKEMGDWRAQDNRDSDHGSCDLTNYQNEPKKTLEHTKTKNIGKITRKCAHETGTKDVLW